MTRETDYGLNVKLISQTSDHGLRLRDCLYVVSGRRGDIVLATTPLGLRFVASFLRTRICRLF